MPKAANADIRVVIEALMATTIERNAIDISTNVMPMTTSRNSGSRSKMRWATSSKAAVWPPM